MSELAGRLEALEARLTAACAKAGRPRESVRLVAVSKLHPASAIEAAHALGLRDFGENYAQELRDKARQLAHLAGLRWHAIGPVQPKNAKYVAATATLFHALESLEVARELDRRRQGPPLEVLIEVNLAQETSKAGLAPEQVKPLAEQLAGLKNVKLVGLTAMPPLVEDAEVNRPHFRALKQLAGQMGLLQLSMGTTADFEVAIEEGATLVRVGTALFGERPTPAP